MPLLEPGTKLGQRFELLGVIGQGGMATVYLAFDALRQEQVALKILHDHLAQTPSMRERLRREVVAAGHLRNPHTLVAYDLHDIQGGLAVSLPFHSGKTLSDHIAQQGPLSAEALQQLCTELASSLVEAHRHGIIHRDVTPANVLIDPAGRSMLTDFGLARFENLRSATATSVVGTTGYAAPETFQGIKANPLSDIYSLGAVLYFAASGKAPFDGPTPMAVLKRQLDGQKPPLLELRPTLPPALASTVEAMLQNTPELRPQGASAVIESMRAPKDFSNDWDIPATGGVRGTSVRAPHHPASHLPAPEGERREATAAVPSQTTARLEPPSSISSSISPRLPSVLPYGKWSVILTTPKRASTGRSHSRNIYRQRQKIYHAWSRHLQRWHGTILEKNFRRRLKKDLWSVEKWIPRKSREEHLVRLIEREVGFNEDSLLANDVFCDSRFRLVDDVDADTALRLVQLANQAGYEAQALEMPQLTSSSSTDFPRWVPRYLRSFLPTLLPLLIALAFVPHHWQAIIPFLFIGVFVFSKGSKTQAVEFLSNKNLRCAFSRDLQQHQRLELQLQSDTASTDMSPLAPMAPPQLAILVKLVRTWWQETFDEEFEAVDSNPPMPLRSYHSDPNSPTPNSPIPSVPTPSVPTPSVPIPTVPIPHSTEPSITQPEYGARHTVPENSKVGTTLLSPPSVGMARAEAIVSRTQSQLAALHETLEKFSPRLPYLTMQEIRRTLSALTTASKQLAEDARCFQQEMDTYDGTADAAAVSRIEARLERLETLKRAGQPSAADEVEELRRSLTQHQRHLEQADSLESRLTRVIAHLLEIGTTAASARQELQGEQTIVHSAPRLVVQLQNEVKAAAAAAEEVERLTQVARASGISQSGM